MFLQKLIRLINRSTKTQQPQTSDEPTFVLLSNTRKETDEATRPLYRVGKHKPSDFQKAIDLSG